MDPLKALYLCVGPVELVSLPAFLHPHYQACSRSGQVRGRTSFRMSMPAGPALFHPQCHGGEGQGLPTHTHAIVASSPVLPQRGAGLAFPHQSCSASSPTTTPPGPSLLCCPCERQSVPTALGLQSPKPVSPLVSPQCGGLLGVEPDQGCPWTSTWLPGAVQIPDILITFGGSMGQ